MKKRKRIKELKTICAQLYQVIGSLADFADCLKHPDVQRALDNASKAQRVHHKLTPWPRKKLCKDSPANVETLVAMKESNDGGSKVHHGKAK